MLAAIDPSTNKIIFTLFFYSATEKRTFTAAALIKTLETAIGNNNIKDELIIHTDLGPQFTSKKYVEFINNHKFFNGSQTAGGQPWEKPVIERMMRTFKYQLKQLKIDLPPNVKTTREERDLQALVDKRRNKMNSEALYHKNQGLTVNETVKQLSESNVIEPEVLLLKVQGFQKLKLPNRLNLTEVRFAKLSNRIEDSYLLDKIQITNMTTQHMVEKQYVELKAIGDNVNKVL